ncbi:hypothetical protein V8E36_005658 [Tilletia maclaganii]
MVAAAGRTQVSSLLPTICHFAALAIVLLVLISPSPLPFGPSLVKITSASLNTSSLLPSAGSSNTSVFPGVNITLSNASTVQVKPRAAFKHLKLQRVVLRDTPAPLSSNDTASPATAPSSTSTVVPPPTSTLLPTPSASLNQANASLPTASAPLNTSSNATQSPMPSAFTSIKMNIGPLGACIWTAQGTRDCSSPKLDALYNLTALRSATEGSISTAGLPGSLSGKTRSTILLSTLIVLIFTSALSIAPVLANVYPDKLSCILEPGPAEKNFRTAKRLLLWALAVSAVLFFGATVSLRFTFNSAVNAFNAANAKAALPPSLTDGGKATNAGLCAQTGNSFGLLWIAGALISFLVWLERRRMRQADALAQARDQVDAEEQRRTKRQAAKNEAEDRAQDWMEERAADFRGRGRWHHAKRESISSSVDGEAVTHPKIRRKKVDYADQCAEGVTKPAKTVLPANDRMCEDVERTESPQLRHQWMTLQPAPTPGRKQDLPLYMETDHTAQVRSNDDRKPHYF